jgi:Tfp pilus assembly protein PilF
VRCTACAIALAVLSTGCSNADARKRAYFERGLQLMQQGDLTSARKEIRNVLQIDPKHSLAWLALGQIEERSGDARQALEAYSQAIRLVPHHPDARTRHAHFLAVAGELEAARQEVEAALRASPSHPDALTLRGSLRHLGGDAEGAAADALAGLARRPGHPRASLLLAISLLDSGRVAEAERQLDAQVAAHPDDVDLQLLLGRARDRRGDVDGAVAALRGALARAPDRTDVRLGLGRYLAAAGRPEEAKRLLRDVGASGNGLHALAPDLVDLLLQTEGAKSALAELAVLLALSPDAVALRLKVARIHGAGPDPARAEPIYRGIIAQGTRSHHAEAARLELAALLAKLGRTGSAREVLDDQLAIHPRHPEALMARARLALQRGEAARAAVDLRSVLSERPGDPSAHRLLAEVYAVQGNAQSAKTELERAIGAAPDEPEAYLALAALELRAGSADRALGTLGRLLAGQSGAEGGSKEVPMPLSPAHGWGSLEEAARCLMDTRPDDPLGYYLEGLLRQHRGDPDGSAPLFERVLALRPHAVGPAIGLARALLAGDPGGVADGAADLVDLGDQALAAGRLDSARQAYQQAIRLAPGARRAYGRLAGVLMRQGALAEAVAALRVGLELEVSPELAHQLAELHRGLAGGRATPAAHAGIADRYPHFDGLDNALATVLGGGLDAGRTGQGAELGGGRRVGDRRLLRGAWGMLRERRADDPATFRYLDQVANAASVVVGAVLAGFLVVMRRGSGGQGRVTGS